MRRQIGGLVILVGLVLQPTAAVAGDTQDDSFSGILGTCVGMVFELNFGLALDLFDRCSEIVFRAALDSALIAGRDELGVAARDATEVAINQRSNIALRMAEVRAGGAGISTANLRRPGGAESLPAGITLAQLPRFGGGGASGDEGGGRLGFFINGEVSFGDRDPGVEDVGFDFDSQVVTVGLDYRFTDRFFAGVALGLTQTDDDLTGGGGVAGNGLGTLDIDGTSLSLYWSANLSENTYLESSVMLGENDYDSVTEVGYTIGATTIEVDANGNPVLDENGSIIPILLSTPTNVSQQAIASTDGDLFGGSLSLGHDYSKGKFSLQTAITGAFSNVDIDGYDERMSNPAGAGGEMALRVLDREIESLTADLELTFSWSNSTSWGVFIPQFSIGFIEQFEDDAREVITQFLFDPNLADRTAVATPGNLLGIPPGTTFDKNLSVFTDRPDSNYGNFGLGFSAVFRGGHQAFLFWDTIFGHDSLSFNTISGGVRFEF